MFVGLFSHFFAIALRFEQIEQIKYSRYNMYVYMQSLPNTCDHRCKRMKQNTNENTFNLNIQAFTDDQKKEQDNQSLVYIIIIIIIYTVPVPAHVYVLICPESEIVYKRFGHAFVEQLKNRLCGVMRIWFIFFKYLYVFSRIAFDLISLTDHWSLQ